MAVDLYLSDDSGEELAGPIKVELENLSLEGGSVALPSMQADGLHLFYAFEDRNGRTVTWCCVLSTVRAGDTRFPVDPPGSIRNLTRSPFYYQLGLEFFRPEDREKIKLLNRIARGKAEKGLSEVLGDFFKKQLIRAS